MNTIDPAQYPEEHQRLKEQRDSFFESNVVGQVLESIADDLNDNNEYFKDPVKVEEYKQSIISFLTRNKVSIDDAAIIAETAFTKTGAYSVYDNEKNILGISKQNMADIIDYRKTRANYAIDQQLPELVVLSSLVNSMSPEVYRAFSNLPEGRKINDAIAANYASAAKGITNFNIDFGDKSKAISIAQDLQRTTAPALLKGSSMVASAQAVNNVPSIKEISSRDFDTVISNARGVAAIFDNPHTQATKRQLQSSNKPTEQALGIQMDNEERRAKALASAGTYLQSAHKGAQNLRYIMDNSTIFNNLRVNNAGKIVFVPGTSVAGAIEEGIAEQFAGYGQMIDEINADVAAVTGLSSQGLTDFWRSIDIPTLSEGERPQHAPAFNWTSKPVEDLSEIEENLTSEETRAESRELNKDLFSAVETPQAFGEARLSRSEPIVNAHMETPEVYKLTEEGTKAENKLLQSMGEHDTFLGVASEQLYQERKKSLPKALQSEEDYDLRGAYKAGLLDNVEEGMHLPDTFKKPNHITFSKESKYYKPGMWAGEWVDDYTFKIPLNTPKAKLAKLKEYFAKYEPGARIMIDNPKALEELSKIEGEEDSISRALSSDPYMHEGYVNMYEEDKEKLMHKRHRVLKDIYIYPGE